MSLPPWPLTVNINIQARGHKDVHNIGENMIAPLSVFKEGGLDVDGTVTLSLQEGPVFFSPKHTHTTRPWSSGNRVVLVAYSVRDSGKLKADDIAFLRDMGFQ